MFGRRLSRRIYEIFTRICSSFSLTSPVKTVALKSFLVLAVFIVLFLCMFELYSRHYQHYDGVMESVEQLDGDNPLASSTMSSVYVQLMIDQMLSTDDMTINASRVTASSTAESTSRHVITTAPMLHHRHHLYQSAPRAGGRLGNIMFMYASLLGIANRLNLIPVCSPEYNVLRDIFAVTAESTKNLNTGGRPVYEKQACAYDPKFEKLADDTDIKIFGFLQSWKYFEKISDKIRREFTFKSELRNDADEFLRNFTSSAIDLNNANGGKNLRNFVYIGVHIRRGDMLDHYNVRAGYTVADDDYLQRATTYIRKRLPDDRTLMFVVCSDDVAWARNNFRLLNVSSSHVVFSEYRNTQRDLALLAACNHTIMTVGTYGWWAGYLARGVTIYYSNFPVPQTRIGYSFNGEDYYLPEWIGL